MASASLFATMEDLPVPPGFTSLTSFTLQRVERDTSVAASVHSVEHACNNINKLRKLLQRKPWINYSEICIISDSEEEDMPDQSLPNGVLADVVVTDTSLQPQHGQSLSDHLSDPGESSRAGGTAAAPTGHNASLNEAPRSAAMAPNNMTTQQLNLTRLVEIGEGRRHTIEILEYGTVMPYELWSTGKTKFPKGYRSRARYWSVVEPNKLCAYISEIMDAGLVGPLFMVSVEGNPSECLGMSIRKDAGILW